ncbi:UNVERIFIED_CONTAM: hypothetical protein FKN15_018640 [Acipenser sinensis]
MKPLAALACLPVLDVAVTHALRLGLTRVPVPELQLPLWSLWVTGVLRAAVLSLVFCHTVRRAPQCPAWLLSRDALQSVLLLSLLLPCYATLQAVSAGGVQELLWGWHCPSALALGYGVTVATAVLWQRYAPSPSEPGSQKRNGASLRRLAEQMSPDARHFTAVGFFLVVSSLGEMAIPYYTGRMTDWIMNEEEPEAFNNAITAMALITIGSTVSEFVCDLIYNITMSRIHMRIQSRVFRSVLRQDIAFFDTAQTGDITSRITTDTNTMSESLSEKLSLLMWYFMRVLCLFGFMLRLSWKLSLFTAIGLPIIWVIPELTGKFYQKLSVRVQESLAKANAVAMETFSSMKTVRSFANEEGEAQRYRDKLEETYRLNKIEAAAYAASSWTNSLSSLALKVSILYYGGMLVTSGDLSSLALKVSILYRGGMLVTSGDVSSGDLVSFVLYELQFSCCGGSLTGFADCVAGLSLVLLAALPVSLVLLAALPVSHWFCWLRCRSLTGFAGCVVGLSLVLLTVLPVSHWFCWLRCRSLTGFAGCVAGLSLVLLAALPVSHWFCWLRCRSLTGFAGCVAGLSLVLLAALPVSHWFCWLRCRSLTGFAGCVAGLSLVLLAALPVSHWFCWLRCRSLTGFAGCVAGLSLVLLAALGASEKIFEYMDREPEMTAGTLAPETLRGHVEFKNVSFAYPRRPDTTVLKSVSFELRPGEITALVGPSGGGKSTCVCLLERFYQPQSGEILLDGAPLQDYQHSYLHRKVALVSQEPVLFARSVQENISYGVEQKSEEEVQRAAKRAIAHDFITELQEGYSTDAGEKGGQLSGGQKQRVAIARALLRDPRILILDDATSSLDTETEHLVQSAVLNGRRCSVLLISHRLSSLERADRIIVLQGGEVVEQGSHSDLLQRGGVYQSLLEKQSRGFDRNGVDRDQEGPEQQD